MEEYIKTNKYQTKLTEELRSSLHKDVWNDLMEFIESVQFIQWLIQPEDKRGYAKDRPKDEDGKIIVDITKPHILEDMDFFREKAIYFEKHGQYTHLRPNPNPKSEYAKFWKEEVRKWRDGVTRPSDGEWIPGEYYFYLNYSPIWLNEKAITKKGSKKSSANRVRKFPKVWLGDYLFFHYYIQCVENGAHFKMLKTRGVGSSFKWGAISPHNMYVYAGLPNFHLATDKGFLSGEKGIFGKVQDTLDWIAETTPLPKMRLVDGNRSMEIQLGYKDEYGVKRGLKSSVYGISLKDNPEKTRGIRGKLIHYEEDGLFPNLETSWNVNRKAVEDGDIVFGIMAAAGCVCAGTKVWTNDGRLTTIENINKSTGIIGYSGEYGNKEDVTYIQEESYKECVEIITECGGYIQCSVDHPLLMSFKGDRVHRPQGRKLKAFFNRADTLKVGDKLLLANNINIFGTKKMKDAYLVGMLIGDGSYGEGYTPCLSVTTEEVYSWLNDNYNISISKLRNSKDGIYAQVFIKDIVSNLREIGIYGQTGENKCLPINIEQYDKESK